MYMVPRMIAIVWVICIGLFSTVGAGGAETYPQRGRVKIVNNVVVADNGSLLRGASGNSFEVQRYAQFSWWTNLRDNYKLNTVRMFMYCCKPVDTIVNPVNLVNLNNLATNIDAAVENAKRAGMYLILHIYNKAGYNAAVAKRIWGVIAPRYKHETHVIYEAFNEPVHWQPSAIDAADIADQEEIFRYIRARAPSTHIIMWSPAHINDPLIAKVRAGTGIRYSNASVGYHPYQSSTYATAGRLRAAGFPVINTEFSRAKGIQYLSGVWNYHESNRISWIFLDLSTQGSNTQTATPNPSHWPKTWPTDPYYR
jgi:Cellulase (glycosyl hydrolase family 5)